MARQKRKMTRARTGPKRRGLLVGINHYPPQYPSLKGCVNDVLMMSEILQNNFGFSPLDIRLLTDDRATKKNILDRLAWLVKDAKPGDVLVFHYSGHGAQIPDRDGDESELDHSDECICPYDFNFDNGAILDDDLRNIIEGLPVGVNLSVILDCCHSGTGTRDLVVASPVPSIEKRIPQPPDIQHRMVSRITIDETRKWRSVTMTAFRPTKIKNFGGNVLDKHILIAGCKSTQTSKDAPINGDFHGALTYSLFEALNRHGVEVNYRDWVAVATEILKNEFAIPEQDPQLETIPHLMTTSLFKPIGTVPRAMPGKVPSFASVREIAQRHIVYVHGICKHLAGFSDPWWNSMKDFVLDTIPNGDRSPTGNRHEVLWSNLVNSEDRALTSVANDITQRKVARRAGLLQAAIRDRMLVQMQALHDTGDMLQQVDPTARAEADKLLDRGIFSSDSILSCVDDFARYMVIRSTRDAVIKRFTDVVRPLLQDPQAGIDIISHSWGTIVAYEGLLQLAEEGIGAPEQVHDFFTVGAALSIGAIRLYLQSRHGSNFKRPPTMRQWVNLNAVGDLVGGPLKPLGYPVDLDRVGLNNFGCGFFDLSCAHGSYFKAANVPVNRDIFGLLINTD